MLIIYFDEVKYDGISQKYEWICGIGVNDTDIQHVERQVSDIAENCFGNRILSPETELHAVDIFNRKKNFKSWPDISKRISVLKNIAAILAQKDKIKRIAVRIDVGLIHHSDSAKERAFVYFVERANNLVLWAKTHGILIGDFEQESLSRESATKLSGFRENGTPYPYGQEIKGLIDTVHFSHSCSSRMLQLADCFAWFMQFIHSGDKIKEHEKELAKFLNKEANITFPDRYKFWPTKNSWSKQFR